VSEAAVPAERDPFEARFARQASGLLREFNEAGVIDAADVHVARELGRLSGESDDAVLLAAALAVRGPRLGHVHVDLGQIRDTAAVDAEEPVDLATLAWPEPGAWIARVSASPLVAAGDAASDAVHRCVSSARGSTWTGTGPRRYRWPAPCAGSAPRR